MAGISLLLLGALTLLRMLGNPRLAALHGSDVVSLTASGACLGIGLAALFGRVRLRSDDTPTQVYGERQ